MKKVLIDKIFDDSNKRHGPICRPFHGKKNILYVTYSTHILHLKNRLLTQLQKKIQDM